MLVRKPRKTSKMCVSEGVVDCVPLRTFEWGPAMFVWVALEAGGM